MGAGEATKHASARGESPARALVLDAQVEQRRLVGDNGANEALLEQVVVQVGVELGDAVLARRAEQCRAEDDAEIVRGHLVR